MRSQQQTCKYLSSIHYLLSCIWFIFCFLTLLSLSFLYHYFVLKNTYIITLSCFFIFLLHSQVFLYSCSTLTFLIFHFLDFLNFFLYSYLLFKYEFLSYYTLTLPLFFFNYNNHVSYIPMFCLNMVAKYS